MPFINIKVVKNQVDEAAKREIVEGVTELIVNIMGRDKTLTTIVIDEIDSSSWAINGNAINAEGDFVSFVNIKVSKGTTNPEEMSLMIKKIKDFMSKAIGNQVVANYVIIDELDPAGWGFDGLSMAAIPAQILCCRYYSTTPKWLS